MKTFGYLESGHPYEVFENGTVVVDYMDYDQYKFRKKLEENPQEAERLRKLAQKIINSVKHLDIKL